MRTFLLALGALTLIALGRPASAQTMRVFEDPSVYYAYRGPYVAPTIPYYSAYGYAPFAYYSYPLPPAPSLGFGRGGIYGHAFVGRDESIFGFTLPGRSAGR